MDISSSYRAYCWAGGGWRSSIAAARGVLWHLCCEGRNRSRRGPRTNRSTAAAVATALALRSSIIAASLRVHRRDVHGEFLRPSCSCPMRGNTCTKADKWAGRFIRCWRRLGPQPYRFACRYRHVHRHPSAAEFEHTKSDARIKMISFGLLIVLVATCVQVADGVWFVITIFHDVVAAFHRSRRAPFLGTGRADRHCVDRRVIPGTGTPRAPRTAVWLPAGLLAFILMGMSAGGERVRMGMLQRHVEKLYTKPTSTRRH